MINGSIIIIEKREDWVDQTTWEDCLNRTTLPYYYEIKLLFYYHKKEHIAFLPWREKNITHDALWLKKNKLTTTHDDPSHPRRLY